MKQLMESRKRWKEITIIEWFSKDKTDGAIYMNWKLPNGEIIQRLTQSNDMPVVELEQKSDGRRLIKHK